VGVELGLMSDTSGRGVTLLENLDQPAVIPVIRSKR